MQNPKSIRNVCIAGHLHHGKTLLMDMLVQQTHVKNWNLERNYRWLDTRVDEQERLISVKDSSISMLMPDSKGKSYILNFVDTPGHPNFSGELSCALRVCDGVVLVVDAIEGVMMMTQRIIKLALREQLKIVVFVSKMDRLVVELKLPPEDAYLKLKHTLEEINTHIHKTAAELGLNGELYTVSPLLGNVLFGSGEYSFMFGLDSFARLYSKQFKDVEAHRLKAVFWGDFYFNHESRRFQRRADK
jgi:U5 small nuclear ribonucleoprotein component